MPAQPSAASRTPGVRDRDLRSLIFAVQVLDDVDLDLSDAGLRLPGGHLAPWASIRAAGRGLTANRLEDRLRFAGWLRDVALLAALPVDALPDLLRPVGLPAAHLLHPGPAWVQEVVLGDALHLGLGVLGLRPTRPDEVALIGRSAWTAVGLDPNGCWPACRALLEQLGALAAERWALSSDGRLLPMGDCDVATLLGAGSLRRRLAGTDGGMRAVVVPMRRRGWTRLSRLDPAFAPAAAMATDAPERGFLRPLLVTASEVVLAGEGRRVDISLDPVVERWVPTAAGT